MPESAYARLLSWAQSQGYILDVSKTTDDRAGTEWSIGLQINKPAKFHAYGDGGTIDEAAKKVTADLATIGITVP